MDEQEDGQKYRGRMVELIEDHESMMEENPTRIKFQISVNEDKAEEIITYNKMLEYITKDEDSDIQWKFCRIVSHEYKGSQCNVLIEWEKGEITSEPLNVIAADDTVTCVIYARDNGPISFHLGTDFTRDEDNTLCISPTKYIDKLVKTMRSYLV
jgi:hypothetical protein